MGLSFVLILLIGNGSGMATVRVGSYTHYKQCQEQGQIAKDKTGWTTYKFLCIPVNKP